MVHRPSLQVTELHKHVQAKEDALLMIEDQNSQKSSNMVKEQQQLINQVSCTSIHRTLDAADVYGEPTSCNIDFTRKSRQKDQQQLMEVYLEPPSHQNMQCSS